MYTYIYRIILFVFLRLIDILIWWIFFQLSCLLSDARLDTVGRERAIERVAKSDQGSSAILMLDHLPVEILLRVAEFLPLDSAACLILSRKLRALSIGHRSWLALQSKDIQREKFKIFLQNELEKWVKCCRCQKRHCVKRKPLSFIQVIRLDELFCSQDDGTVELMPNYYLRWLHAHVIMELHRLDSTKTTWLNALSHVILKNELPYTHCCARVANGNLLLKLDYRILLQHDEGFRQVKLLFPTVCPHWESFDTGRGLAKVIRCQLSRGTSNPCDGCTRVKQCFWCATEYIVSVLDSTWSPNGRVVYIRAWKNLGTCQSPFDVRWWTHTHSIVSGCANEMTSVQFTPDSVRSAFEDLGSPKLKGGGIASVLPLDSDVEFSNRIDEVLRRPARSRQPGECRESDMIEFDFE